MLDGRLAQIRVSSHPIRGRPTMPSSRLHNRFVSAGLDNPLWYSLTSKHAHLALGGELARRYPPEVAPFAAIPESSDEAEASLLQMVESDGIVGMVNIAPRAWDGWAIQKRFEVFQYVWDKPVAEAEPESEAVRLGAEHIDLMLELTALVYPAYFRRGTAELGDYFGILQDGQLCAIAGTRMAFDGYQEISAVCTHPDHRGQRYAGRLTMHLVRHIQNQGDIPFLHTETDNETAQKVYDRLGFVRRAVLPCTVAKRV